MAQAGHRAVAVLSRPTKKRPQGTHVALYWPSTSSHTGNSAATGGRPRLPRVFGRGGSTTPCTCGSTLPPFRCTHPLRFVTSIQSRPCRCCTDIGSISMKLLTCPSRIRSLTDVPYAPQHTSSTRSLAGVPELPHAVQGGRPAVLLRHAEAAVVPGAGAGGTGGAG